MITLEDVFAIPKLEGQLSCQDFYDGISVKADIEKNGPIMHNNILKKVMSKVFLKKDLSLKQYMEKYF